MTFFTVSVTGQIEKVKMLNENLYVKYQFVNGQDWTLLDGTEQGISQFTDSTLNVPLQIAYKSTSFYGWPMLLVTVYGLDFLGRDVVRGYSCTRLPCSAGTFNLTAKLFAPVATTPFNQLFGWLNGKLPEFLDSAFASKHEGRQVTRVSSHGVVEITLHIMTKNIQECGYSNQVKQ